MVKLDITPLTEKESELVQSSLDYLSEVEVRGSILSKIFAESPELEDGFSMVVGCERQSSFLMNMMRRGFNYVCYESFNNLYDIFVRHPKYGVTLIHLSTAYSFILETIEEKYNDNKDMIAAWKKVCKILEYIAEKAYNPVDEKKLNKMRNRIFRSMSNDDIQSVLDSWKVLLEDEMSVAQILANLIHGEKKIVKKFHEFNIDVFKQSVIILRMVDKTLKQLQDIDELMPFLKKLGKKHVQMGVGPRLLASMKPVIIKTLEKSLGFGFTNEIKTSWNKVLSFIIGIMVQVSREGMSNRMSVNSGISHDEYGTVDYDNIIITNDIIRITTSTWKQIDRVIDQAVGSFYKDLLTSKPAIRNLFSKSNMNEQSRKLLRAIGSTVALLDNQDALVPILEELGRRHVYYNVQPKYFKYIKKAWFNMLKAALALKWDQQVQNAWNVAWEYITTIMINALEDALLLYIPPEPEKVSLKVLINHIDRVEAHSLSFYGDIWYAAFTNDNPSQSTAFNSNCSELNNFYDINNAPKELAPFGGIKILNSMDTDEMYRKRKQKYLRKYTDDEKEQWYMRGNLRGTFAQQFNLASFPFDQHKLTLTIALETDDTVAVLNEDSLFVRLMPFKIDSMAGADWDIYDPVIQIKEQSAMSGGSSSGKKYTHAEIQIPISRKWNYHLYQTILPLVLIEVVAWSVYFASEFPMVQRLAVLVTLLLTLFAFKWTVSKSLPPTSYLTLMDYFFNSAYLLLFLHIVGLCLISLFEYDLKTADTINWCVCISTFCIWLLIHSYLLLKSRYYVKLYPKKGSMNALDAVRKSAMKSPTKRNSSSENNNNQKKSVKINTKKNKYQVQPVEHEV